MHLSPDANRILASPRLIELTPVAKQEGITRYIAGSWADLLPSYTQVCIMSHFLARAETGRDFAIPFACLSFSREANTRTKSSSESFFARSRKR